MKIRAFGTAPESIVDGKGIRYSLFVQGCFMNCEGCHNPKSHDINGGFEIDTDKILAEIIENPLLDGITLSGGEPFLWAVELSALAKKIKDRGLNVWTYTGYTFEAIIEKANPDWLELLKNTDVLVDGSFKLSERSLDIRFRGSKNQRLIDVKRSLEKGMAVLLEG